MSVDSIIADILAITELAWTTYHHVRECRKRFVELKIGAESLLMNVMNLSKDFTIRLIREYLTTGESSNGPNLVKLEIDTLLDGLMRTILPLCLIFEDDPKVAETLEKHNINSVIDCTTRNTNKDNFIQPSGSLCPKETWSQWNVSLWTEIIASAFNSDSLSEIQVQINIQMTALNLFMTQLTHLQLQRYSSSLDSNRSERIEFRDHQVQSYEPRRDVGSARTNNESLGLRHSAQVTRKAARIYNEIITGITDPGESGKQTIVLPSSPVSDTSDPKTPQTLLQLDHEMLVEVNQVLQHLALPEFKESGSCDDVVPEQRESGTSYKGKENGVRNDWTPTLVGENLSIEEKGPDLKKLMLRATVEDEQDSDGESNQYQSNLLSVDTHILERVKIEDSSTITPDSMKIEVKSPQSDSNYGATSPSSTTSHQPSLSSQFVPQDPQSANTLVPPEPPASQSPTSPSLSNHTSENSQPNCNICSKSVSPTVIYYTCSSNKKCEAEPKFRYPPYSTSHITYTVCQPCYSKSPRNRCPGRGRSQCGKMSKYTPQNSGSSFQTTSTSRQKPSEKFTPETISGTSGAYSMTPKTIKSRSSSTSISVTRTPSTIYPPSSTSPKSIRSHPRPTLHTSMSSSSSPIYQRPSPRPRVLTSSPGLSPSSNPRSRKSPNPNVISISPLDPTFNTRTTYTSTNRSQPRSPSTHSYHSPHSPRQSDSEYNFSRMRRMLDAADEYHGLN